jgi:hypothetical protein
VLVNNAAQGANLRPFGFFEYAWLGVPMVAGTLLILLLLGRRLVPVRTSNSLPADFSQHARTLVEQYRLDDGLHRLRVRSSSPYVGKPRDQVDLKDDAGLSLIAMQDGKSTQPLARPTLAAGDVLVVRGDSYDRTARLWDLAQQLRCLEGHEARFIGRRRTPPTSWPSG